MVEYLGNAKFVKFTNMDYFTQLSQGAKDMLKAIVGTYRANGLLIGSGAIESAHRNVLQQRLKLSGQRWSIEGAQNIANLRAYNKGNQWGKVIDLIKNAA